jgi:hypothetical protein
MAFCRTGHYKPKAAVQSVSNNPEKFQANYPQITYSWTGLLISDHSYLVGNLTNSKVAETKTLEPLKS